jgi:hypothetical protein
MKLFRYKQHSDPETPGHGKDIQKIKWNALQMLLFYAFNGILKGLL